MGARLVGKERARSDALASIDALEKRFASNIQALVLTIDTEIKALTPVNTGEAVRNYIWSRDMPSMMIFPAIDNGPPGPTNSMALGVEPRRKVNEVAAALSMASLNIGANPFGAIYLTNNAPDIVGLELGVLPGPPLKSRSPAGMFGITAAFVKTLVTAQGILR